MLVRSAPRLAESDSFAVEPIFLPRSHQGSGWVVVNEPDVVIIPAYPSISATERQLVMDFLDAYRDQ